MPIQEIESITEAFGTQLDIHHASLDNNVQFIVLYSFTYIRPIFCPVSSAQNQASRRHSRQELVESKLSRPAEVRTVIKTHLPTSFARRPRF